MFWWAYICVRYKNIPMSTIWWWLKYLGYHYEDNKRNYYTGGQKRYNIVNNCNNSFLIDYFRQKGEYIVGLNYNPWLRQTFRNQKNLFLRTVAIIANAVHLLLFGESIVLIHIRVSYSVLMQIANNTVVGWVFKWMKMKDQ